MATITTLRGKTRLDLENKRLDWLDWTGLDLRGTSVKETAQDCKHREN